MSKSVHQFEIRGIDKSGAAFQSIKGRAAATSSQIKSMVSGALAFAGAYIGSKAIIAGVNELGHLSDLAQKTGQDVGELTASVTAFNALGIQNMGAEQLGKAFDYMAKTTGRSGMAGFYETIAEIGKIPDAAKRGQEAMRVFGRSGMEFMPLINAADQSVDALQTVINAMPAVPQAAADAGDAIADAMGFGVAQVKSIWLQGLGAICGWLDNEYKGGAREAALAAGNYLEYYTKVAVNKVLTWYGKIQEYLKRFGEYWGTFIGTKMGGGSWSDAFKNAEAAYQTALGEYEEVAEELERREEERAERFKRAFEDRKIAIQKFQGAYNAAAISLKKRQERDAAADAGEIVRQTQVRNDLVMGGSNAVTRMQILGPSLQSESKKQTSLLQKIAENTETTAENTEATADDLGVID